MRVEGGGGRLVAGFACNQAFLLSVFYLGENRALSIGPGALERADLFGVLVFLCASFLVLRAVTPRARDALLSVPLLWCYAALCVVGRISSLLLATSVPALVLEGALVGFPAGLLLAAWGRALAAGAGDNTMRIVFSATAVAALACLAASALPGLAGRAVLGLLPVGSALFLQGLAAPKAPSAPDGGRADRRLSLGDVLESRAERDRAADLSRKILAGTVLFGAAAGFMETFASDPGEASMPAFPATLILLALFCAAALQLVHSGGFDGDDPGAARLVSVYRLALFVMMAGFLFIPLFGSFGVTGESIVLAGYLGLSCVLVCLFLVVSRIRGIDAALSFSSGFVALYAGELGGLVLGNCIELLRLSGALSSVATAIAGLAALFAYLFLFTEQDFRELSVIARRADRLDEACRAIASRFGLSPREAEILPFALKGRTSERIATELCISRSTVDTHLRRIYAKTGTHGRQDLIDLGEETMAGLS